MAISRSGIWPEYSQWTTAVRLIMRQTMTYGGVKVQLHTFLTVALCSGENGSHTARFTPEERLDEPYSRSARCAQKSLAPAGNRNTFPVSSSPYPGRCLALRTPLECDRPAYRARLKFSFPKRVI
jgi:hypothetical protein